VVELASTNGASPSDEGPRALTALRNKMTAYQANGARPVCGDLARQRRSAAAGRP
jgi:hypothetical protein